MKTALVAAMAKNRVIGKDGGLPWRLPEDLKHFKRVTMGHPMVMGRKTYESIGRPLPGRANIVITRNPDFRAEGVYVEPSVDAALARAETLAHAPGADWIMVIGGGEIYRQTIGRAGRLYLTEVDAEVEGDTVFPAFDAAAFEETERRELPPASGAPGCAFITLDRIRPIRP
ncbi:MAG: dihydrofolate reductase [Rhodospirillales bacterium]